MFVSALRKYFSRTPVPMRTVCVAAGMLSVMYVFTSYINRSLMVTYYIVRFDWWKQAPIPFLNFGTWVLVFPLIYGWSLRWPLNVRPIQKHVLALFGLGLVLCSIHELFTNTIYIFLLSQVGRIHIAGSMWKGILFSLPGGILQRFMEYWLLQVLLMYIETHRQVQEERTQVLRLRNELQTTQLLALKKQLQPHFLFNTLNTVSALMDRDMKSARYVLARLGQLLRNTLDEERKEKVTLIHEVDHVGDYLGIESVRFKDRLVVDYDIPWDCQNALVPGMVLQPLVENSIKHGPDAMSERVRISIEAERKNDRLVMHVKDDGKGCADPEQAFTHGGIGLRNVRDRIELLYGQHGSIQILTKAGQGFQVIISLPFETQDKQA
ncbi:MAG: histidine kinase [Flavobacteriales bacterium]